MDSSSSGEVNDYKLYLEFQFIGEKWLSLHYGTLEKSSIIFLNHVKNFLIRASD